MSNSFSSPNSVSASCISSLSLHDALPISVRKIMTVNITIGTRFPAHSTSMGRVILGGMPDAEIRSFLDSVPLEHGLTPRRSEEHTSELQSRGHLVCRLLLE